MEKFRHPEVPPDSELPEWGKESIEKPIIHEEVVDEATLKKIKEAERVQELVAYLNERLDEVDEKVLESTQLGEFLEILTRESEDALREGLSDRAEKTRKLIRDFNDYAYLSNDLNLGHVLETLSVRWSDLKEEIEAKLKHKL
jgi:hypothetical protein